MEPLSFKAWASSQGYKNHPTDQTALAEKAWTFCLTHVLESQKKYLELLNIETNNLIELKSRLTNYEATIQTYRKALESADDCINLYSHPGSMLVGKALQLEVSTPLVNELVAKELERIAATYGEGFDPAVENDLKTIAAEWRAK